MHLEALASRCGRERQSPVKPAIDGHYHRAVRYRRVGAIQSFDVRRRSLVPVFGFVTGLHDGFEIKADIAVPALGALLIGPTK